MRAPSTEDYGAIRDFKERQQSRRAIVHSTEPSFWEVFEAAVRAHGGHVTSPPNYSDVARIECPPGSNIPDDLRSMDFIVYPVGQHQSDEAAPPDSSHGRKPRNAPAS
jgi:hypothetical protein